jgi:beta-galactosidase
MSKVKQSIKRAGRGSVELNQRRILIDGSPRQLFAGEVHYFRLARGDWENRLQLLKNSGFDTVATYIPWIWHELPDGDIDLTGRTHPQRDLAGFIDLCASYGLNVIVRPGPFVMAELKNEGIPYRLYKAPFVQPVTWKGAPTSTRVLDYLAPDYLGAVAEWYAAVMPVIASRLKTCGGPIIAVQLDNEIGMLQWVSNCPDLSDYACEEMREWCLQRYGAQVASARIGADVNMPGEWADALRNPAGASLALHHDIGLFMRDRFRRYVQTLRSLAEGHGVDGVPFVINVHGTGGNRGLTFPIGISQLFESYRDQPQMTAGSDIYLGDLTVCSLPDLYLVNAFMESVQGPDQPLTSLEFEAGNGNYGDDLSQLYTPEAAELKARLCIAQGNRLLNFYLHCGGENPPLPSTGDGIDRIAFTGQRHGFAAPVSPEGAVNATYGGLIRLTESLRGIEHLLAASQQQYDDVSIGFVPDHYLTEYRFQGSQERAAQTAELERYRGAGRRDVLVRSLLLNGFSFPAVNLQSTTPTTRALIVATGSTLGKAVQERLVEYVRAGGKLLLAGLLPDRDHDGAPCTVLADALGLRSAGRVFDEVTARGNYWPSIRAQGWAAPRPEVRASFAQLLAACDGRQFEPFLTEIESGLPCAATVPLGAGHVTVLGCDYPSHLSFYKDLMAKLGVTSTYQLDADAPGVMLVPTRSSNGTDLLHIINVAPNAVAVTLRKGGKKSFGGRRLTVPARSGFILPCAAKGASPSGSLTDTIQWSTAELLRETKNSITLRSTQPGRDVVVLKTNRRIECRAATVLRKGNSVRIVIDSAKVKGKSVTIKFSGRLRML